MMSSNKNGPICEIMCPVCSKTRKLSSYHGSWSINNFTKHFKSMHASYSENIVPCTDCQDKENSLKESGQIIKQLNQQLQG